ncbi:MAG: hypothetical protein ACXV8Y_17100 [Acidimicrobiia bacterium]
MAGDARRAVTRVADALRESEDPITALARVPGADLGSFLLAVAHRRADAVTPAALMRRQRADRFVEPGTVDARALHRVAARALDALPAAFEVLELAPVAPLGTCSTVATVDQDKVVATMRGTEVAADPTNALTLLAGARRRSGSEPVRLAAVQRVLRAQPQSGGQAHFTVLGLVTSGRDRGNLDFERASLVETLGAVIACVRAVTDATIELRITSLRDSYTDALVDVAHDALTTVTVVADPDRASGRGYYRDVCFKVRAGPDRIEIGDGGFVDWTRTLSGDRRERQLIAGLGVDRLTTLA